MKQLSLVVKATAIASLVIFSSCKKDTQDPKTDYSKGTLIVCEGQFGKNNGDITYIKDTIVIKNLYEKVNGVPLGDVVQSMTNTGDYTYIVVNNSQKIEVVDSKTFESVATIKNLSFPRYVEKINEQEIAISNGNGTTDNYVYIATIKSHTIIDSIAVGNGPNRMVKVGDALYVANMGGYGSDNKISVINTKTKKVEKTIETGDMPASLAVNKDNNIYVLTYGLTEYDEQWNATVVSNSKLQLLKTSTNTIETIIDFDHQVASLGSHIISYYNGTLYYLDDAIYSITDNNTTPTKIAEGYFYSITANENIWVTSTSATGHHKAIIYSPTGTKVNEYITGFYPNSTHF